MKKWLKEIKFVVVFCVFAYLAGALFSHGAIKAARLEGIAVAIAIDDGGSE